MSSIYVVGKCFSHSILPSMNWKDSLGTANYRFPSVLQFKIKYFITAFIFLLLGCQKGNDGFSPIPGPGPLLEPSYCSEVRTFDNPVTISGTAQYYYRAASPSLGLTGNPIARAIPFAEVTILDQSGSVVQCSETDGSGNLNFTLMKNSKYTVRVSSRANNSQIKISVLKDKDLNLPHFIETSLTTGADNTMNMGTLFAYARVSESPGIEGGAFNILWAVYQANEALRTQIDPNFVAPKITCYWKAGFDPSSYSGQSQGISYYDIGTATLYILGGSFGDVSAADTDHFDNSVILHEYGHFLEDTYGIFEAKGGPHNGQFEIEPRLAWSEGWANFFQAFVLNSNYYIDTVGFSGDSVEAGNGFTAASIDLATTPAPYNAMTTPHGAHFDGVTVPGQGEFREMSISRTLYKTISPAVSYNGLWIGGGIGFNYVWEAFTDSSIGFRSTAVHFRSAGQFNSVLLQILNSHNISSQTISDWTTNVLNDERQSINTKYYSDPLNSQSSTCIATPCSAVQSVAPVSDGAIRSMQYSNQFYSNKSYRYYYDGNSINAGIQLNYSTTSGHTIDLDLFVYDENYKYQEEQTQADPTSYYGLASASTGNNPGTDTGTEVTSLLGRSPGWYIINVKSKTYGITAANLNGTATFNLSLNSGRCLCPQNL